MGRLLTPEQWRNVTEQPFAISAASSATAIAVSNWARLQNLPESLATSKAEQNV
jgi:hypothetical protein